MPYKDLAARREYDKAWKRQSRLKDDSPVILSLDDPSVMREVNARRYRDWLQKEGLNAHG